MSETYFIKKSQKEKFTILDNTCVQDNSLSWKSKGVHTYLMSLPPDWKIFITEIVNHSSDGKAALYSAIQELEKHGYIKKVQNRREDGCFGSTVYYVYENPNADNRDLPLSDYPHADYPEPVKPDTDNRTLLNTNKLNINLKKTKPTNYEPQVSESVFIKLIKGLFGEYLFDNKFEAEVLNKLNDYDIDESNLEAYLNYVFDRTKLANPQKSFEGLYRKLALSNSILRDFKLSNQFKFEKNDENARPYEKEYECPICYTLFKEFDYYCPTCSLSVDAIKENNQEEIKIKTKLYQMPENERIEYEFAYHLLLNEKGRCFLTPEEQHQFYKDFGILD